MLHPEKVDHLVVLSVGHPAMFTRPSVEQLQKSWHHLLFQFPDVAEEVLRRDDWHFFREWLDWLGGADDPDRCVDDLARPGALTAALNWYRANALPNLLLADPKAFPSVQAPTLAVFGKFDRTRSEEQVASSAAYVAGPWRFERFEDAGHWVQLEQADRLNRLLVEFLS